MQIPLLDYVRAEHPRALFVGYGETDDWAHAGRYDLVLKSAHQFDAFVKQLWDTMQAMPEYHDQTTFIVTTDHGRGGGPDRVERPRRGRKRIGEYLDRRDRTGYSCSGARERTSRQSRRPRSPPPSRRCWEKIFAKRRRPRLSRFPLFRARIHRDWKASQERDSGEVPSSY